MVTNVFEAVDVITIIKGGMYDELNLNVGEALQKRQDVGISCSYLCSTGYMLTDNAGLSRHLHVFD